MTKTFLWIIATLAITQNCSTTCSNGWLPTKLGIINNLPYRPTKCDPPGARPGRFLPTIYLPTIPINDLPKLFYNLLQTIMPQNGQGMALLFILRNGQGLPDFLPTYPYFLPTL